MKVSLVQINSTDDKLENLRQVEKFTRLAAAQESPDLIVLPELCNYLGGTPQGAREAAEVFPEGETYRLFKQLAIDLNVHLHAGSVVEREGSHVFNTSFVFDGNGKEIARYRKIHLFDVTTPDGLQYRESATYSAGGEVTTYSINGIKIGCAICYDLRFPELFVALAKQDVDVIIVPAAFTLMTGKDHWEVLCRSRALDTQAYILACNQTGSYIEEGEKRFNFGNSMVVDPWGTVIARVSDRLAAVSATLDFTYQREVRQNLPVQSHRVLP